MPRRIRYSELAMLLLAAVTMGSPNALLAQRDAAAVEADCRAVRKELDPTGPANTGCKNLAVFLGDAITDESYKTLKAADTALKMTPRKLQSVRSGEADLSGVPGQASAAPTAQPSPLASASLSGVGTDAGTKGIAAISLNPVTLLGGTDSVAAAKWSRFADLTALVPVSSTTGSPGSLGYFGLRGRINLTGLRDGDRLLSDVSAAFKTAIGKEAEVDRQLRDAFQTLPDSAAIAACARAALEASYGDSPKACLGKVTIGLAREDYDDLHRAIQLAREKADARYFGLDLRFDHGDPTLARDPTKEVDAIQAGLAFGRRSLKPDPNALMFGLQGRLGVRYSDPKSATDSTVWALDGALGFETSRVMSNDQPVRFSTGLEFRYSNKSDAVAERSQTDYLVVKGGLAIPLIGGTSVSVGFTGPLTGDVSPDLSVNFNWGLLMSSLTGAAGAH